MNKKQWTRSQKLSLIGIILTVMVGLIFGGKHIINKPSSDININGNVEKSLIAPNSTNPTLIINENKQIPYSKMFVVGINNLRTLDKELFNVKYILPDEKEAFIPELIKGEKYTLFYTNDDMSDIYVSEKYRMTPALEGKVCWTVKLFCNANGCDNDLAFRPSEAILDQQKCFER